jgi:hypothetical protein
VDLLLNLLNVKPATEMTELIFRFTPEELNVLQYILSFFDGNDYEDDLDVENYQSLFNKVMSN